MASTNFLDMVQESGSTPHTGTVTLTGAVSGFIAFSVLGVTGRKYCYRIEDSTNSSIWELGLGTYTLSGTTLSRDTVYQTSNGNTTKIDFTNAVNVRCIVVAEALGAIESTLLDLNGVGTVIDDDFHSSPILIPDTTKPASPQYTKTILSGNIPVNSDINDWGAILVVGGKNTDVASRTITVIGTVNGTEKGSQASTTVTAGNFWFASFIYRSAALAANDVLGLKMWASVTNVVNYQVADSYVVPRTIAHPGTNDELVSAYQSVSTGTLAGGIAAVSYTGLAVGTQTLMVDSRVSASTISTGSSAGIVLLCKNQMPFALGNSITDLNSVSTAASLTLQQPNSILQFLGIQKLNKL